MAELWGGVVVVVDGSEQFCSAVLEQKEKVTCLGWHKDGVDVSAGLIWMSSCQAGGKNNPNSSTTPSASAC